MIDFFESTMTGLFIGIAIGFVVIFALYANRLDSTAGYNYFRNAIENNITIEQATFTKFPNKYKLDYTNWKDLK